MILVFNLLGIGMFTAGAFAAVITETLAQPRDGVETVVAAAVAGFIDAVVRTRRVRPDGWKTRVPRILSPVGGGHFFWVPVWVLALMVGAYEYSRLLGVG